jgi:hypothetical protein
MHRGPLAPAAQGHLFLAGDNRIAEGRRRTVSELVSELAQIFVANK